MSLGLQNSHDVIKPRGFDIYVLEYLPVAIVDSDMLVATSVGILS